mmetsp:Transcript_12976/g.40017  ORF Transcript_12976/g.40017 Transcript_12976/m.40017 type:complete len:110 (+) Transcript_12976:313-642(+)
MSLKAMDHLEVIKLLCKDFWYGIFRKQIDKLQTNHRGVFVLKDYSFRWMHQCSCGTDVVLNKVNVHVLQFPCGLLRGALSSLGLCALVTADPPSAQSTCSFNIHIHHED